MATWYPHWVWMSIEDRKQVWLGWVWIQPRGNRLRESWASKISSSPRAATVSLVPSCLGTMRVVMEKVSAARSRLPARMPQLSMLLEVLDLAYLRRASVSDALLWQSRQPCRDLAGLYSNVWLHVCRYACATPAPSGGRQREHTCKA